jgi:hypothetical protein
VADFCAAALARLKSPNGAFRKACVRQFVNNIEVNAEELRITGSTADLTRGILSDDQAVEGIVPSFDRCPARFLGARKFATVLE